MPEMLRRRRPAFAAGVAVFWMLSCTAGSGPDGPGEGSTVDSFAMPGRPSAVAVAQGMVWVADDRGGVVWMVNPRTGGVLANPVEVAQNPTSLAAGEDAVWVGHAGGEITAIDLATRHAALRLEVEGSITGIAVDGTSLWVADNANNHVLEVVEEEVVQTIEVPDGAIRVAASDGEVWVSGAERSVARIDQQTGEVTSTVEVGSGPIGLVVSGGMVWVASSDVGVVSRIDPGTAQSEDIEVGGAPVAVVAGESAIWVASQETESLTRIDPNSLETHTVQLGTNPRGIALGEGAVWVVGTDPGRLIRVSD